MLIDDLFQKRDFPIHTTTSSSSRCPSSPREHIRERAPRVSRGARAVSDTGCSWGVASR